MFDDAELIHSYSRAQALEDGVLIDVSSTAREAGIRFPTAMTSTVWARYVEVPEGVEAQDEEGRLWDILWMLRCAVSESKNGTDRLLYKLLVRNDNIRERMITLKSICGPGDDARPVITIMLPEED